MGIAAIARVGFGLWMIIGLIVSIAESYIFSPFIRTTIIDLVGSALLWPITLYLIYVDWRKSEEL